MSISEEKNKKLMEWYLIESFKYLRSDLNPPKCHINSWDYIEHMREFIISDIENAESLEPAWEVLNEFYDNVIDRKVKHVSSLFDSPLEDFIYTTDSGFYPRPEFLVMLVTGFQRYLFMDGLETLEEIFFGDTQRRVGNYSAQKLNNKPIMYLHRLLRQNNSPYNKLRKIEPLTQLEAAELTIQELQLNIEPESLIRKYSRFLRKVQSNG